MRKEENKLTIEYVYSRYFEYIYKIFYFKTHNIEDSQDLTTKTFLKINRNLDRYNSDKGAISTWITTIANNIFIDFLRSNSKRKNDVTIDENLERKLISNKDSINIVQYRNQRILNEAIKELKPEDQALLILRYTQEYSYEEIAYELKISVNNVGIRINRLHKKLKEILEKKDLINKLD